MRSETVAEIGYVLKGYPRLSETFITHEIHQLEQLGMKLRVYSVKPGESGPMHAIVGRIHAPVRYVPEATSVSATRLLPWLLANVPRFAGAHRELLRDRPGAWWRTLRLALALAWRYRRGPVSGLRKVYVKEFLQAGAIAAEVLRAGTVRHLHGHFCHGATTVTWFASELTGLPFSFTAHAKDIYEAESNPGDLLSRKLRAARFATTCTAANHAHIAGRWPGCGRVHTVYHGLDTTFFAGPGQPRTADGLRADPARAGLVEPSSTPLILAVGRFVEKKGFAVLVEACARLAALGVSFRCLLVGEDGDERPRILRLIDEHGLGGRMAIRGAVTQEELRSIYAQAQVFCLPCLVGSNGDRDGIPNVLAEAMAMGLPAVSTAISGIPELVDDGLDGLLVPERDPEALAAALRRLLADSALRHSIGTAARAKICRVFDSRRTTVELRDLFQAAIAAAEVRA